MNNRIKKSKATIFVSIFFSLIVVMFPPNIHQNPNNLFTSRTISIRITCLTHFIVLCFIFKEEFKILINILLICSNQLQGSCSNTLWTFCRITLQELVFPKEGASSWTPPESVKIK